jgi:uncharacterized protein
MTFEPLCRAPGFRRVSFSLAATLLLASCSSVAPPRFHTLLPSARAASTPASGAGPAWQMPPVTIPAQVDQPQFVVRRADDTLAVLEQERWIAPLQDEIRAALVEHLTLKVGSPGARPLAGRKDWRVVIDVSRFDSTPGRAGLVVEWALLAGAGESAALRCRSRFEQPVDAGMAALAAGHRQNLERLGASIALGLTTLDAGQQPGCPAATQ